MPFLFFLVPTQVEGKFDPEQLEKATKKNGGFKSYKQTIKRDKPVHMKRGFLGKMWNLEILWVKYQNDLITTDSPIFIWLSRALDLVGQCPDCEGCDPTILEIHSRFRFINSTFRWFFHFICCSPLSFPFKKQCYNKCFSLWISTSWWCKKFG